MLFMQLAGHLHARCALGYMSGNQHATLSSALQSSTQWIQSTPEVCCHAYLTCLSLASSTPGCMQGSTHVHRSLPALSLRPAHSEGSVPVSGIFKLIGGGAGMPVVAFALLPGRKDKNGNNIVWDEYDLAGGHAASFCFNFAHGESAEHGP